MVKIGLKFLPLLLKEAPGPFHGVIPKSSKQLISLFQEISSNYHLG